MSTEEKKQDDKRYYSIVEGTLRTQVPPNDPEAIERHWKTPDGKEGVKYERLVQALFGTITDIQFHDGEYGKNLNITLDPDEDGVSPVISVSASSRYGESILKQLRGVSLEKEVRIRPYDFKGTDDKDVRGVEITHRDEEGKFTVKVPNFYWDYETKKPKNGYPETDEDDKLDWKFYYTKANKFMVKDIEAHVLPRFSQHGR